MWGVGLRGVDGSIFQSVTDVADGPDRELQVIVAVGPKEDPDVFEGIDQYTGDQRSVVQPSDTGGVEDGPVSSFSRYGEVFR